MHFICVSLREFMCITNVQEPMEARLHGTRVAGHCELPCGFCKECRMVIKHSYTLRHFSSITT